MQNNYNKIFQASLLIALSGILYGFLGFFGTKVMREHFSISTMLFWRFFIAGSWMLLFVIKKHVSQESALPINKRILFFIFFLGAIGYAGSSGFYFISSQYAGTGLAMVIFFSYPIMVALASWIINKQNLSFSTILVLLIMTASLFLLRDTTLHPLNIMGIFFGILAALCYALYVMGSKHISAVITDSNILTALVCFGCAFIFLILALSSHSFILPHSIKSWLYLLALGILATAIPIQLMLKGLKYVSSMRASIISVLEPLVTLLVGVSLLHESLSHLQMAGAFLLLISAILVQFQREL